jgi:uncharacterized protein YbbK (DUF523 family)
MIDLLDLEKTLLSPHIKEGGTAVDFTMGNGHDTLWLSQKVGLNGKVYSFDIQQAAIDSTKQLLNDNNIGNAKLILDSHSNVKNYVKENICAGMFNLGYLPGGDKSITTRHETTLRAIVSATELLDFGGALLIAVYPGHEEGTIEGNLIENLLSYCDRKVLCCSKLKIVNSPKSPFFFLIEKSDTEEKEYLGISDCLLGTPCRYDGQSKGLSETEQLILRIKYNLVPICPEQLGGLPTPRIPSEIRGNKVIMQDGTDVTDSYITGAQKSLEILNLKNCKKVLLKEKSPSCGKYHIYDGSFSKTLIDGSGITAEYLKKNGMKVFSENELEELL